jgi:hypothetical protein
MAIYGCGLPARCCQPAVTGGIIYADLWGELSTHLAPTGIVYSEFSCVQTTATSFPLSKHTGGGDTAPTFSGWCVYLQLTWEVGLPPSPMEFSSHCRFYKLSHSWFLGMCCCSCLLWPSLKQLSSSVYPIRAGSYLIQVWVSAFSSTPAIFRYFISVWC